MQVWKFHSDNHWQELLSNQGIMTLNLFSSDAGDSVELLTLTEFNTVKRGYYLSDVSILNDACVLDNLRHSQSVLYVVINQLESAELQSFSSWLSGVSLVFVYVDMEENDLDFFQKIQWLKEFHIPFCLCSNRLDRLLFFSLLDPHSIFCDLSKKDFEQLNTLLVAPKNRPVTVNEIDCTAIKKWIITSNCDLNEGSSLSRSVLTFKQSSESGLPVHLIDHLDRVVLRYPLKKNEPVTVGHLYIEKDYNDCI